LAVTGGIYPGIAVFVEFLTFLFRFFDVAILPSPYINHAHLMMLEVGFVSAKIKVRVNFPDFGICDVVVVVAVDIVFGVCGLEHSSGRCLTAGAERDTIKKIGEISQTRGGADISSYERSQVYLAHRADR
jgi:hypothetical protein